MYNNMGGKLSHNLNEMQMIFNALSEFLVRFLPFVGNRK
jgi:hypothetical protein